MTNHIITGKQLQCVLFMFLLGSVITTGFNKALKQDSWIAILIGGAMAVPLVCIYARIIQLYPGQNIFDIVRTIFGNIIGKIMIFLLSVFAVFIGALAIQIFAQYIRILNMPETPEILFYAFLVLICSWAVTNGPENIGRIAKYLFPIFLFLFFITIAIGAKDMKLDNLMPIMDSDFKTLLNGSFFMFMLPFGELVVCLPLFSSLHSQINPYKIILKGLAYGVAVILAVTLRNMLILGIPSTEMFYFPSYHAASIISIGDFFTRIEVIIGLNLMLAGFIKISVCLYTVSLGVTKIFNYTDQKTVIVPTALVMLTLAGLLYTSSLQVNAFLPYAAALFFPFQVIIPVIIWIGAEIKTRISKSKTSSPTEKKGNSGKESTQSEASN